MERFALLLLSTLFFGVADTSLHDRLNSPIPAETFPFPPPEAMGDKPSQKEEGCSMFPSSCHPGFSGLESRVDYYPQNLIVNDTLPYRYRTLIEDTLYLQLVMLGTIGVLTMMPESVTHWNMADLQQKSLGQRWKDNVSQRPAWDNDDWTINYIGHPVSGAWYYTLARNDGMSIGESVAFSAFMSTFVWEYGYEAFAEVPSVQDLFVTPLVGSVFGEGMYLLEQKIDANGGRIWGSEVLGNIGYFVLNPLGNIAHGIKHILYLAHIKRDVTVSIRTYPNTVPVSADAILYRDGPSYGAMPREYGLVVIIR